MLNVYAGLSQLRSYFDFTGSEGSATNTELRNYLVKASRIIDGRTHRKFFPSQKELWFDLPENRYELRFPRYDVFELLQLADYNGGSPLSNNILYPMCGTLYDMTPYNRVRIAESSGSSFNSSYTDKAIKLTASIGFTENWKNDEGWVQTGASLAASGLTSSLSALPITGTSSDVNSIGDWPAFWFDQIIRVKSGSTQEIMTVTDTTINGSTLGVIRGINGTAASVWGSGIAIESWYPPLQIQQATLRLTAWLYESRSNPQGGRTIMPSVGQIILQDNIPEDVVDTIKNYTKFDMGTNV